MRSATVPLALSNPLLLERRNPATGAAISSELANTAQSCLSAAGRAAASFPAWSARAPSERAQLLCNLADQIEARAAEFIAAITGEIGATYEWAAHNVSFAARCLRETAGLAAEVNRIETLADPRHIDSHAERVPCGVCLGIVPWNAPLILGVRALAMPLLCGNPVLVKGNEFAPATFRLLGSALDDAGFPAGVAQILLTLPDETEAVVAALIASPVVRRVSFTGSTRIGRQIAEHCARHLKRPLLELGGHATMIVLEDADLDLVAEAALNGAYLNQGQICSSTEHLIVADGVADAVIARIETRRRDLRLGNPADRAVQIGPVISVQAVEHLSGLIADALAKGARLVGGGRCEALYFEPTLIDGVERDMRLYHEEAFGPILSITRISDAQEAITVANDSEYGLASAVFSADGARALAVARQLHTGICHINRSTVDDTPLAPFGGVKASGYGRFGGLWAIPEFTELRWITRPAQPD
jgi:vanillin dehydrogenase